MGKLAITGGKPVRTKPFAAWPIYGRQEERALLKVLASRNWGGYPFPNTIADRFAQKFAKFHGAKYGLAVANGTVAIQVALKAAGIKPGDEVIVPAYTWEGTVGPVLLLNAVPVFVDVDPDTYCLDARLIEAVLTERLHANITLSWSKTVRTPMAASGETKARELQEGWAVSASSQAN